MVFRVCDNLEVVGAVAARAVAQLAESLGTVIVDLQAVGLFG